MTYLPPGFHLVPLRETHAAHHIAHPRAVGNRVPKYAVARLMRGGFYGDREVPDLMAMQAVRFMREALAELREDCT